jgi:hypothetical protein
MDRRERLPENLLKLKPNIVKASIQAAINEAVENTKRDDTQAIPFVFSPKHKFKPVLQWLLPLYLSPDNIVADAAIVVERLEHGYRAASILTIEMAYKNARVIRTPPRCWLPIFPVVSQPVKEIIEDPPVLEVETTETKEVGAETKEVEKKDRSQIPCRYFLKRGTCTLGDKCSFQHIAKQLEQADKQKDPKSTAAKSRTKCPQMTNTGYCSFGDKCWYSHVL